jgi:hypothetical protein
MKPGVCRGEAGGEAARGGEVHVFVFGQAERLARGALDPGFGVEEKRRARRCEDRLRLAREASAPEAVRAANRPIRRQCQQRGDRRVELPAPIQIERAQVVGSLRGKERSR